MSTLTPASKSASGGSLTLERGTLKLLAKLPPHDTYFCSYEVALESDVFKPDTGRLARIYFVADTTQEKSYFDYGRFCFYLPKSVQPMFEEALSNKAFQLTVQFIVEGNRPFRDQTEAVFHVKPREGQGVR